MYSFSSRVIDDHGCVENNGAMCDVLFLSGIKTRGIDPYFRYAARLIFFDFLWVVTPQRKLPPASSCAGAGLCLVQVPSPRAMRAGDVLDTLDRVALFRAQAADSHRRVEDIGGDLDSAISLLDLGQSRRALKAAHALEAAGKSCGTSLLIVCALRTNC